MTGVKRVNKFSNKEYSCYICYQTSIKEGLISILGGKEKAARSTGRR